MKIADRIALWRHRLRLRRLQDRYYRGSAEHAAATAGAYLTTLASAREIVLRGHRLSRHRVHLGAGGHELRGWINVDIAADVADVLADFTAPLPFRTDSVDLLHSEDLLEHLDEAPGKRLLAECHRVLRPGGVMRLLTPDLRALIDRVYLQRDPRHLAWCNTHLSANGPCEALNMHLRMNGDHRFVYDEEHLTDTLRGLGFQVRRVRHNRSTVRELRYLDLRDFGLNLFLEAVK
ncbi:MAG: class I SAM-dependent methyltransferase [Thermoanaerobaculia bacterium]